MRESIYFVGAGFTKSLQRQKPIPLMMDFVRVMAYYARTDDVVLMALIGLEAMACYRFKSERLRSLADDIKPKRHRWKLLWGIRRRKPESIEFLLAAAEQIEQQLQPLIAAGLRAAIYDPVLRSQYAINRMFHTIGWNLRSNSLVKYLKSRCTRPRQRHTFVSFNYDLALEHALEAALAKWCARTGYGAGFRWAAVSDPGNPPGPQVVPLTATGRRTVRVLKPHGSLNWLMSAKGQGHHGLAVVAATAAGNVRYVGTTLTHAYVHKPNQLPIRVSPFIVPPTSCKNTDVPLLRRIRAQEAAALAAADEVYVLGWSLPQTDTDQIALIRQIVAGRSRRFDRVVAVNLHASDTFYRRVARIFGVPYAKLERFDEGLRDFTAKEAPSAG